MGVSATAAAAAVACRAWLPAPPLLSMSDPVCSPMAPPPLRHHCCQRATLSATRWAPHPVWPAATRPHVPQCAGHAAGCAGGGAGHGRGRAVRVVRLPGAEREGVHAPGERPLRAVDCTGPSWTGLDWTGLNWRGLRCTQLGCIDTRSLGCTKPSLACANHPAHLAPTFTPPPPLAAARPPCPPRRASTSVPCRRASTQARSTLTTPPPWRSRRALPSPSASACSTSLCPW